MKSAFLSIIALATAIAHPFAAELWPSNEWSVATAMEAALNQTKLEEARDYALSAGGSGYITRHGQLVLTWGDVEQRYDLKSSTKSFGSIALGLAIKDGKVRLDDLAAKLHPALGTTPDVNTNTGWLNEVTLLHLASQTAGFEKPGGFTRQLFRPGTMWDYSDSGPNWLAECLTLAYRRDLDELMFERVFTPLGIQRNDLVWRKNQFRPVQIDGLMRREFGSGISANVEAMARIGLMMLRGGRWRDAQIIPHEYIEMARQPLARFAHLPVHTNSSKEMGSNAPKHYGLLWWNNADGLLANVPRDAYWSWGLYDSVILVVPSLDIVVARAGKSWPRKAGGAHYDPLRPFFEPIIAAVSSKSAINDLKSQIDQSLVTSTATNALPRSALIKEIRWAPTNTIVRGAKGSDNWPLTWADDDALYGVYGDGNGFAPFTKEKLSLGFTRITGTPQKFRGENIRAPSLERFGDGTKGLKASGMLCVKGVLYLWARNAGNSQLAWSSDHGRSWAWADWKFTNSFGCPTFLNFGRDYEGNSDGYAYVCSTDADNAYSTADRFVLACVPAARIREREAYEFFRGRFIHGNTALWTTNVAEQKGILSNPGICYRPNMTYVAGLNRFLLVQSKPNPRSRDAAGKIDVRFHGGLVIYEAPQPWGPWSIVFDADEWDVGPGDSASFPAKWISSDGRTLHLVFTGDDSFSLRRAELILNENGSQQR
jgi:CubicO group peptidase (beta-lactamase class C family)